MHRGNRGTVPARTWQTRKQQLKLCVLLHHYPAQSFNLCLPKVTHLETGLVIFIVFIPIGYLEKYESQSRKVS